MRARALRGERDGERDVANSRVISVRCFDLYEILTDFPRTTFVSNERNTVGQTVLSDRLKFNMRRHLRNFSRSNLSSILYRGSRDLFFKQRSNRYDSTFRCSRGPKSTLSLLKPFPILKYSKVTLCRLECISHTGDCLKIQKVSALVITNRMSFSSWQNKCMTTFKRLVRQESVISSAVLGLGQTISLLFHNFPNFKNREARK